MRTYVCLFLVVLCVTLHAQMTGPELLGKAIKYHDPKGNWETLNTIMYIEQTRPGGGLDTIYFMLNNKTSYFLYVNEADTLARVYEVDGRDSCLLLLNGSEKFSKSDAEKHKMTCRYARLIRNYSTYLWGLPMKLRDPGTIVHEMISEERFQDIPCYKLKVTYEEKVGKDIWYFYFKKENYALHGYKFHRDESKNDGEYITLEGIETYNKIKIPKRRKWYYNKDDKFLGTDTILPENSKSPIETKPLKRD